MPIRRRPFVAIGGRHYCCGLYNLTDHVYRIFQRAILSLDPDYREIWNQRQKRFLDEQEQSGRPKPLTITGGIPASLFCSVAEQITHTPAIARLHTLASMRQAREQERMAMELTYSPNRTLLSVHATFLTPLDIRMDEMEELETYTRRMIDLRFERHFALSGKGKVGRNERCPCGSGRKYKKCCGSPLVRK
jgi:hypothetical protein